MVSPEARPPSSDSPASELRPSSVSEGRGAVVEGLIESIAQLTWQDLLTVASVLFGVVSLIGYFEQRKAARQQASLARFAQLNVDKAVTEEDLEALEGRRASMEAEVLESIPGLARQAVLRQQVAEHSKAASEHFRQLRLLEDELGDAHESSGLDQAIRAEIVDRLLPEYERQRNLDELRNRITVFSVSIALAGTIAPAPLDIALAVVLAGPLVRSLVQFGRVQVERERFEQLVGAGGTWRLRRSARPGLSLGGRALHV